MAQTSFSPRAPEVSGERVWGDLNGLAEFVEAEMPGWTRRVFSPPYKASRARVRSLMEEAGLTTDQDAALPAIVIGSHTDTVAGGGRFDGMVGVVAALEVARQLFGWPLRHPLWVVDFLGEEPNDFGLSCLGSRAVTGRLSREHLQRRDGSGRTLGDALEAFGCRPAELATAQWPPGSLHAYLELHIEQGKALEQAGSSLGVVTAIAGISRAQIDIKGSADHAGTTAMADRHDALAAAAEVVLGVDRLGRRRNGEHGVATTGRILVEPNAANVVPAWSQLVVEMRSTGVGWLREAASALEQLVAEVAARRSVEVGLSWLSREPPVPCDPRVRQLLGRAVEKIGLSPMELESGASHDAAHLAGVAPMGMLFVPSRGGRSHCPEEWTDPAQVEVGARALLLATIEADGAAL
jgi:N-carbamoyl-L-amino-acid hydrolase